MIWRFVQYKLKSKSRPSTSFKPYMLPTSAPQFALWTMLSTKLVCPKQKKGCLLIACSKVYVLLRLPKYFIETLFLVFLCALGNAVWKTACSFMRYGLWEESLQAYISTTKLFAFGNKLQYVLANSGEAFIQVSLCSLVVYTVWIVSAVRSTVFTAVSSEMLAASLKILAVNSKIYATSFEMSVSQKQFLICLKVGNINKNNIVVSYWIEICWYFLNKYY